MTLDDWLTQRMVAAKTKAEVVLLLRFLAANQPREDEEQDGKAWNAELEAYREGGS